MDDCVDGLVQVTPFGNPNSDFTFAWPNMMSSIAKPFYIEPKEIAMRPNSVAVKIVPSRRSADSTSSSKFASVVNKYKDTRMTHENPMLDFLLKLLKKSHPGEESKKSKTPRIDWLWI